MTDPIPVLKPRLPTLSAISGYIRRIDEARWYSNNGPLVKELERRIAGMIGLPADCVLATSSCTSALIACLRVLAPDGGNCLMPSFTFPACPGAALAAGLMPVFADVDPDSWALTPEIAAAAVSKHSDPVSAILTVSPFGAPVRMSDWAEASRDMGLPVLLDAAAGIDALLTGRIDCAAGPVCISLHATKALGAGEGGLAVFPDADSGRLVRSMVNFGFAGSRSAVVAGFNGKMSEYSAAIALAALDEWSLTRSALMAQAAGYLAHLSGLPGIRLQPGFGTEWISGTLNVDLGIPVAGAVTALREQDIDCRQWWETGCHRQPAYAGLVNTGLAATELLAPRILGLPFYGDAPPTLPQRLVEMLAVELTRCGK